MKKIILFSLFTFFVFSTVRAGKITDGGENLSGEYEDYTEETVDLGEMIPPDAAIEKLESSSTLASQGNNSYSVKNLFDRKLETCWTEGKKGCGKGEWVQVTFKDGIKIHTIAIANGYQKNAKVLAQNSSVMKMDFIFQFTDKSKSTISIFFPPPEYKTAAVESDKELSEAATIVYLADTISEKYIYSIRFVIEEVYPGTKYDDTCISELYFFGSFEGYGDAYGN